MLGLLELLGRESAQSQRRLAAELGIAVGLVNIYLKRCVKKGLLKMTDALQDDMPTTLRRRVLREGSPYARIFVLFV